MRRQVRKLEEQSGVDLAVYLNNVVGNLIAGSITGSVETQKNNQELIMMVLATVRSIDNLATKEDC